MIVPFLDQEKEGHDVTGIASIDQTMDSRVSWRSSFMSGC